MERKFKIGDKVEVADGNKGVIVDEIYNQITGRLFSVDCGENGFGLYKASDLKLIEEKPERKFEFGDIVWDSLNNRKVVFSTYEEIDSSEAHVVVKEETSDVSIYFVSLKTQYIQPYTGQDKVDRIDKSTEPATVPIKSNSDLIKELLESDQSKLKNKKTFTVILKSGVKIGVTEDRAKQLNADLLNGVSSTSILENKVEISGVYFKINSIAAIVPTESLMP